MAWMRATFIEAEPQPDLTFQALLGALRHDEGDGRICRRGFAGGHTYYAMAYVCRERAMFVSDGYPRETPFVEHRV